MGRFLSFGLWSGAALGAVAIALIAGYRPDGKNFDAFLVGYYEGRQLMFAGKVRGGVHSGAARVSVEANEGRGRSGEMSVREFAERENRALE